ncbi:hypothetical protein ABZW11_27830 [Nonomuraea sp. NPDC004580]
MVHWPEFDRGGHYAALQAPGLLADDLRTFFASLSPPVRVQPVVSA